MIGAWLMQTAETVAASATATASAGLTSLPLLSKGLLTTLFGLLGVFLVLLLFFVAIRLMQRIGVKKEGTKE
ncbi:MAG: hypothetical protein PHY64_03470 [Eubacteriales bacterium]|nr:hypothetical protein [Eubacteriales bacterium]